MADLDDMLNDQTSLLDEPVNDTAPSDVVMPEPATIEAPAVTTASAKAVVGDSTAPLCYNCGNQTQRSGSCYVCTSCGSTTGCS